MGFETNVFVNCPFDRAYLEILRPILFCIIDLGLDPQIALERPDSGTPRIHRILDLIRQSKFGIHDLSRIKASRRAEYFRLNMPFELGLDVGSREFGDARLQQKKCLILETERYRFQAAISDLSNSDIAAHHDEPSAALTEVRNWLACHAAPDAPGPTAVRSRFRDFMAANHAELARRGYSPDDISNQPIAELIPQMKTWRRDHPH